MNIFLISLGGYLESKPIFSTHILNIKKRPYSLRDTSVAFGVNVWIFTIAPRYCPVQKKSNSINWLIFSELGRPKGYWKFNRLASLAAVAQLDRAVRRDVGQVRRSFMTQSGVYILECSNGYYYVGSTNNLERRFEEHSRGHVSSTRNRRSISLMLFQPYPTLEEARRVESALKKFKSRTIIRQIIEQGKINIRRP